MHKTEYFSDGGSSFSSNFSSRQAYMYQNAVNNVFEKQIYNFLRTNQVLRIFTKKTVLLETISRKKFYFIGK